MADGFEANGLAASWTPVALSRELKGKPRAVTVAGVAVALFRDAQGRVGALADRCPHRGVSLSLGQVTAGCLECPFHGWRFSADGACAAVPLSRLPDAKRGPLGTRAFEALDAGGLVWLYTGNPSEAGAPPVPADLLDPAFRGGWRHVETWATHWTRAMENMLDVPHLPFVHRRTIGRAMRKRMGPDTALELSVTPDPSGARVTWRMGGDDFGTVLRWLRPNGMELDIRMGGRRRNVLHVWCVPQAQDRTRMIVATSRNFARWPLLGRLFDQFSRLILLEDRAIVSSSQPPEVPSPSEERSVPTDRATLHFRSWYLAQVRPGRPRIHSLA